MTLVRALHGMAAMAGVGAPWSVMGVLIEQGREGEWEGERGARLGVPGDGGEIGALGEEELVLLMFYCVREEEELEEREEKEKREREERKKGRKNEKIAKPGNFRGEK
jgi:hypothetical protein